MIEPALKQVDSSMKIYGLSTRTKNSDEFNEKTAKIPTLWKDFYNCPLAENTEIYGVYSNYESDANGFYSLTIGVPKVENNKAWNEIVIASGKYLVFENKDSRPETIIQTWQYIWEYFNQITNYKRNFMTDFEWYKNNRIAIYIGIC